MVWIWVKNSTMSLPMAKTMPTMATAIPAMIKPYSMAAAPDMFLRKSSKALFASSIMRINIVLSLPCGSSRSPQAILR